MLSFSINNKIDDRTAIKVVALMGSNVKPEYLGAAYIKIVEGSDVRAEAQQEFMKRQERTASTVEVPVDEVYDSVMSKTDGVDFELEVQQALDLPWVYDQFHLLRYKLSLLTGADVWRLLCLTQDGDRQAGSKLRAIVKKYDRIFGIKEIFTELLMTPGGLQGLKDILGVEAKDAVIIYTPECEDFLMDFQRNLGYWVKVGRGLII